MMNRRKEDKQGESIVTSYRYLGVSIPGLLIIWSNKYDVSYLYGTRASFQYIRMKPLGSWNLVNPLLSMNEAWMDECAARLQPLVNQYKPIKH